MTLKEINKTLLLCPWCWKIPKIKKGRIIHNEFEITHECSVKISIDMWTLESGAQGTKENIAKAWNAQHLTKEKE